MSKPILYTERYLARLVEGTLARIKAVLEHGENQADLIRTAIERELKRRERSSRNPSTNQDSHVRNMGDDMA